MNKPKISKSRGQWYAWWNGYEVGLTQFQSYLLEKAQEFCEHLNKTEGAEL